LIFEAHGREACPDGALFFHGRRAAGTVMVIIGTFSSNSNGVPLSPRPPPPQVGISDTTKFAAAIVAPSAAVNLNKAVVMGSIFAKSLNADHSEVLRRDMPPVCKCKNNVVDAMDKKKRALNKESPKESRKGSKVPSGSARHLAVTFSTDKVAYESGEQVTVLFSGSTSSSDKAEIYAAGEYQDDDYGWVADQYTNGNQDDYDDVVESGSLFFSGIPDGRYIVWCALFSTCPA